MIPFLVLLVLGVAVYAASASASSGVGGQPVGGPGTTTPFISDKQGTTWFPLSPELLISTHPSVGATPLATQLRSMLHVGQVVAVTFTSNGGITDIALGGVIRSILLIAPSSVTTEVHYDVEFQTVLDTTLLGSTPMPSFAFPIGFNVKASDIFDTVPPTVHPGAPFGPAGSFIPAVPISLYGDYPLGPDTSQFGEPVYKDASGLCFMYSPTGTGGPGSNETFVLIDCGSPVRPLGTGPSAPSGLSSWGAL